jgi:hypothetical protein
MPNLPRLTSGPGLQGGLAGSPDESLTVAMVKQELPRLNFMTSKKTIVTDGTPERVAYDLMVYIGEQEQRMEGAIELTKRDYWLALYRECHKAAKGVPVREGGMPSTTTAMHSY